MVLFLRCRLCKRGGAQSNSTTFVVFGSSSLRASHGEGTQTSATNLLRRRRYRRRRRQWVVVVVVVERDKAHDDDDDDDDDDGW